MLKLLRQSEEFCSEHATWQLNMAHTFFMLENAYPEAIIFYEVPIFCNLNLSI